MENHHFDWANPLQMAIFHSYDKLPEGNYDKYHLVNIQQQYGTSHIFYGKTHHKCAIFHSYFDITRG